MLNFLSDSDLSASFMCEFSIVRFITQVDTQLRANFVFFVDFYFTSIYSPILTSFLRAKWQKWTIKRINTHTRTHTTTTKYIYTNKYCVAVSIALSACNKGSPCLYGRYTSISNSTKYVCISPNKNSTQMHPVQCIWLGYNSPWGYIRKTMIHAWCKLISDPTFLISVIGQNHRNILKLPDVR